MTGRKVKAIAVCEFDLFDRIAAAERERKRAAKPAPRRRRKGKR